MRSIPKLLLVFAALSIGVAAQTLTTFEVNPKGGASPSGINDNGDVVGTFGCPAVRFGGPTYCGFFRSGSTGVSKHLGNGITPFALNDSDEMVGTYRISAFYWLSGGKLVQFLRGTEPVASAINTAGYIAGSYRTNYENSTFVAFLMNPQGQISTIFAPATGSVANVAAMNNSNQVVGDWNNGKGVYQGFVYSNGTVNSAFNYPGAVATYPYAINDSGEIAGSWTDSVGFVHGFYWTQTLGFTSFDAVEHTTHTIPTGINSAGMVAGFYWTDGGKGAASFTYDTTSNTVTLISIPHARVVAAVGVNAQGTVVGSYDAGTGVTRGFLYQP
jgi:probable HAF family extracellular repeat protein